MDVKTATLQKSNYLKDDKQLGGKTTEKGPIFKAAFYLQIM